MGDEPNPLLDSVTSRFAMGRNLLARTTQFLSRATFRIKRGKPAETIEEIGKQWTLDAKQRAFLLELGGAKAGAAFIDERVQGINRAAFHRSAFALNALTHLLFVDLAAQLSFSLPQLKLALVAANLVLAALAYLEMRRQFRSLVAGPNALPPRRRLGGLFSNPKYNKAVKKSSRHYAQSAWTAQTFYRPAYFGNAVLIFLGSQFILASGNLIFPFGFIIGKVTGLLTTMVAAIDVWRGIRTGDDARVAREREVSVYRDLEI
jgi:hypothetical protein